MASFNKVILIGNLTRDPELRVTGSGLSICKLGLAVNRTYTSKDGESKDETTYVDVDSFGKQAEILGKYMQKGRMYDLPGRRSSQRSERWVPRCRRSPLLCQLQACHPAADHQIRKSQQSNSNSGPG